MTDKLTHHHLSAEEVHDEHGKAVMLTQQEDGYDEPNTVLIHPWQLRAVCEQFGIIASDPQAARAIATLQRRMLGLRGRIEALCDWMAKHNDQKHPDRSYEAAQLHALRDIAGEWCNEFADRQATQVAPSAPCKTAPAAQTELR